MKNKLEISFGLILVSLFIIPVAAASVSIAPYFPQGNNYVLECTADFTEVTSYDWDFGDGQKLYDVQNSNVWHTFSNDGIYEVACAAYGNESSQTSLLRVQVGTNETIPNEGNISLSLDIAPHFPQGPNGLEYVFICAADGFTPTSYDWNFGDGQKLYDNTDNNVFHRYGSPGEYSVVCTASNSEYRAQEGIIIAGGIDEDPTELGDATLTIKNGFPHGEDYVLMCDTNAFEAVTYDWFFGDGSKLLNTAHADVWHTYDNVGTYSAECDAKDGSGELAKGKLEIVVS